MELRKKSWTAIGWIIIYAFFGRLKCFCAHYIDCPLYVSTSYSEQMYECGKNNFHWSSCVKNNKLYIKIPTQNRIKWKQQKLVNVTAFAAVVIFVFFLFLFSVLFVIFGGNGESIFGLVLKAKERQRVSICRAWHFEQHVGMNKWFIWQKCACEWVNVSCNMI